MQREAEAHRAEDEQLHHATEEKKEGDKTIDADFKEVA